MRLPKLFDTSEIEAFATALAEDLARRFPPSSERRSDKGAEHQIAVILDGLSTRAARFRDERRLGIYSKAKLGNVFQWRLRDLGYSDRFIERATKAIVTRLAIK